MVTYLTLLVLIVFSSSDGRHCHRRRTPRVCQTKGCKLTADNLRKYMDLKIDPCEDFYQFACGKYINNTKMPSGKSEIGRFIDIEDDVSKKLIKIVEKLPHQEKAKPLALVKMLYKTCMDKEQRDNVGNKPLKDILKDLGGGWPVQHSNVDWKVLMYKLRKLGYPVDTLINLKIGKDPSNSTRAIIALSQPEFLISKGDIQNDKIVRNYYDSMVKAAVALGATEQLARKALNDSLKFELELIKSSAPYEKLRIARTDNKPQTLAEVQIKYPSIDWLEYIEKILNIRSIKITKHEKILVEAPDYIKNVGRTLKYSNCTAVANYIMWRAVYFSSSFLGKSLFKIKSQLRMMREGTLTKPQREEQCIEDVLNNIPLATGSLYVRKFFNKSMKRSAEEMVKKLKSAFGDTLNKTKWLDKVTKGYALKKLASMRSQIGYDDQLVDDQILNEYYLALELRFNNYLKQILNVSGFNIDKQFLCLRKNQNELDWSPAHLPTIVAAMNLLEYNLIYISAAILDGFAFSKDTPQYMNYGAIGFIIAHEITHGFDELGHKYNKDGIPFNWWTKKACKVFNKKVSCLIDQYSDIAVPEASYEHLNGENSIGENIADNGGITTAYKAYKNWVKHEGTTEPYLPGLNYSPNQMFWISYANVLCAKYTHERLVAIVFTNDDPHLPSEYRVLVPLRNSEAFSKDFSCPLGSKMNPYKKCRLW